MIDYQFDSKSKVNLSEPRLIQAVVKTLDILKKPDMDITLRMIDDDEMHHLNLTFRGEDKTTDVLSFNQDIQDPETGRFYLGDILISVPQAAIQAADHNHSLQDEITFLSIHGTLHLLGYDHYTEEEKAIMWPLQDKIFSIVTGSDDQAKG
ncbi:MAG: rRNA maturation RNase YbeY [Anaerolineaceae bacterium]|nr:rRNA maturation RNase YbeY [Anaerolineaceae bacterium]